MITSSYPFLNAELEIFWTREFLKMLHLYLRIGSLYGHAQKFYRYPFADSSRISIRG